MFCIKNIAKCNIPPFGCPSVEVFYGMFPFMFIRSSLQRFRRKNRTTKETATRSSLS